MAHITQNEWKKYIAGLRKVNDKSVQLMAKFLERFDVWELAEHRQEIIDYAYGLATKYGEAAAALACQMYDAIGVISDVAYPAAEPAATATYQEVAKAVNGTIKTGNKEIISSAVGRLTKQAGVDTTQKNAIQNGDEWAWIPSGDTCAFCITLASRGWQKASKKAQRNGHAEHIHANCDCTYAIRHNANSVDYSFYDPEEYRDLYYDTDPNAVKPKDRINAMRRKFYEENSEKINAQKRSAYAKQKEREASAAEELNV